MGVVAGQAGAVVAPVAQEFDEFIDDPLACLVGVVISRRHFQEVQTFLKLLDGTQGSERDRH